jgi:hypothetical protein
MATETESNDSIEKHTDEKSSDDTDDTEELEENEDEPGKKSPRSPRRKPQPDEPSLMITGGFTPTFTPSIIPYVAPQPATPQPSNYKAVFKDISRSPRTPYKCNKCGQPKRGHICTAVPQSNTAATFSAFNSSTTFHDTKKELDSSGGFVTNSPVSPVSSPKYSENTSSRKSDRSKSPKRASIHNSPQSTGVTTLPSPQLSGTTTWRSSLDFQSSRFTPQTAASVVPPLDNVAFGDSWDSFSYPPATSTVGSVLFTVGWFDMAINAIETLSAHLLSHLSSNWANLPKLLEHLKEEKEYLEAMREEFQIAAAMPPEDVAFLGKRSISILRDFQNGTLMSQISPADLEDEPANKRPHFDI